MKSKRAEQVLDVASFTDEFDYRYVHFENAREAVELAEQDAEERYHDDLCHYQLMMNDTCSHMIDERDEEITRYRTELEESKKREELARKVIDDQREEMEKLKERAVWAFCTTCRHNHKGECRAFVVGYRDDILHESCANVLSWENGHLFCESGYHKFIQKLNER